ncbi:SARP family transcriptional regulator [Sphaerisporangium rufum]|uniref:SARP family transcriptional regulator n=1 Tax=Sphaerisporangium rufum TaxID=1381558 RepID=A0A919V2Q3_9ACTN|nr:AfsR/SARP family transcriptional regulator [Sphaerisporangium rufum]GII80969.1 SARP family transcriptional regulator [Sphaerisporangium rufum]
MGTVMLFKVLGTFEVRIGEQDLTPSAPKLRTVLSLLLINYNRITRADALIDELWGDSPPISAATTLQTYIYQLRRMMTAAGHPGEEFLVTKAAGYEAQVPPEAIDIHHFERLVKQGRESLQAGELEQASETLGHALTLWRGSALTDVPRGRLLDAHATKLEESHLNALEMRMDAALRLGRHREQISELKELTANYPICEGFYSRLMLALYRSERRSESLAVYQRLRAMLNEELGLEPSQPVQRLQQAILRGDPSLELPARRPEGARGTAQVRAAPPAPPAELPPDIVDFTDRSDVRGRIEVSLDGTGNASALPIVSLTGMAGVGKTALATHVGHRVRSRFADGQLYVNLRGMSAEPRDSEDALGAMLRAGGLRDEQIPKGIEARRNLFRTWSADRSLLVVLDDACSGAQVRPLFPTGPNSAVIVTSRSPLYGLTSADHIELGAFDVDSGLELLRKIIGGDRVTAEENAARSIVEMCGALPLGLRIAGERLAAAPHWTLERYRSKLTDESSRLTELRWGDLDVRTRLACSFRQLDPEMRQAFTVLGSSRQRVFSTRSTADLLNVSISSAEDILSHLIDMRLMTISASAPRGDLSCAIPELIRLYGAEEEREHCAI